MLVAAPGCARRPPRLLVGSARLDFPDASPGAAGRLTVSGSFAGLRLDARQSVRLEVGASTRWVTLQPVPGRTRVFAVDGAEHGYALVLDLVEERFAAVEPDVVPGRDPSLAIGLGQAGRSACTVIGFRAWPTYWAFAADRDPQTPCEPAAAAGR